MNFIRVFSATNSVASYVSLSHSVLADTILTTIHDKCLARDECGIIACWE